MEAITQIDHLVYAVPNLEKGMNDIEDLFGVRPVYGGKHEQQGTHNALLNLGNQIYFELLAIDPENKNISPPRWMGVDLIEQPILTRWAVKSQAVKSKAAILKSIIPMLGATKTGMRKRQDGCILNWELSIPLPGPKVELLPFFIDWKDSEHPTASLPQHCTLIGLKAKHPKPEEILLILESLGAKLDIEQSDELALIAEIDTPKGKVTIG